MDFEAVKEQTGQYIMPSYARCDVAFVSGKGATFTDTAGRRYIDFGSGIGVNSLGTGDPEWVAAVSAQAARLAHCSNLYYSPAQTQLAQQLCTVSGFRKVFFCNSGAEANEGAVKLARKYSFDKYGPGRSTVVTLENSFHGRTVTTLSATGQAHFHQYFFPFTEGFRFTPANDIDAMEQALSDDVCAVILEAVQGEGGVLPLQKEFVERTAALAKNRDILLIFDEVQTGVGRTGKFCAHEHFGIKADVVSLAKALAGGLPFGAVLAGDKACDVFGPGDHGSTFGGNPVACAAAGVVLSRLSQPGFLETVAQKGAYIRERLGKMPTVKNVRGMGMMIGFETEKADSKTAAQELLRRGLVILTAKSALRMLPPLVITQSELDEGLTILEQYLSE